MGPPGDETCDVDQRKKGRVDPLRSLIWIVLAGALFWAVRELAGRGGSSGKAPGGNGEEMVRDPQCGVYLPVTSALKKRVRGETAYFCSRECEREYINK